MDTATQNKFSKAAIDLAAMTLKSTADKAASPTYATSTYGQSTKVGQAAAALSNLSARAVQGKLGKTSQATAALSRFGTPVARPTWSVSAASTPAPAPVQQRVELETVDDECVEIRVGGRHVATLLIND